MKLLSHRIIQPNFNCTSHICIGRTNRLYVSLFLADTTSGVLPSLAFAFTSFARLKPRSLNGSLRKYDSPFLDGVLDRYVGEFHDDLQCLAKRDVAQRGINGDGRLYGDVDLLMFQRLEACPTAEWIVRIGVKRVYKGDAVLLDDDVDAFPGEGDHLNGLMKVKYDLLQREAVIDAGRGEPLQLDIL